MVETKDHDPEVPEGEEQINLAIDAALLHTWASVCPKPIARILDRSQGGLVFYASEAMDLAVSAQRSLPGLNAQSGIDVAAKFAVRIGHYIPGD